MIGPQCLWYQSPDHIFLSVKLPKVNRADEGEDYKLLVTNTSIELTTATKSLKLQFYDCKFWKFETINIQRLSTTMYKQKFRVHLSTLLSKKSLKTSLTGLELHMERLPLISKLIGING